jgi:hypothetical protein
MRFHEIISPFLAEAKNMSPAEWMSSSTVHQFISRLLSATPENPYIATLTFRVGKDSDVEGQINITAEPENHNYRAAKKLQAAVANKNKDALLDIYFDISRLDDNDNPTTDIEKIHVTKIVKDELYNGKLRVNKGNIAEIVLGCAVTAKYRNPFEHIDAGKLIEIAEMVAVNESTGNINVGKDLLSFMITVPASDKKGFAAYIGKDPDGKTPEDYGMGKDLIKSIDAHIDNAVKYVNTSPRVAAAIDKAFKDPRQNQIEIKSDGGNAEEQKSTKADLKILIDGSSINLLSIKAGDVGQFGQVSGYQFDRLNEFFTITLDIPLSDMKTDEIPVPVKDKFMAVDEKILNKEEAESAKELARASNYKVGFKAAYDEIFQKLKTLTGSQEGQVDLLQRVYKGLKYHATRDVPDVEMIILSPNSKKAFYELTFGSELENALDDYQLVVHRGTTESMHEIYIYGYPKTAEVKKEQGSSKELLIKLRSYAQKKAVRNIVEMGDLLKDIADWEKIQERKAQKVINSPTANDHLNNKTSQALAPQTDQTLAQQPNQASIVDPNQTLTQQPNQAANLSSTEIPSDNMAKPNMADSEEDEPIEPVNQEPDYQQKIKESDDQVLSMIRGISKCVFMK